MKKSNQAVIVGDIINSSLLTTKERTSLIKELKDVFEPNKIYFYRGDSFQLVVTQPAEALTLALRIKTYIKSRNYSKNVDARMAIGIGPIENKNDSILEADGTAFILSGRALDNMKEDDQTITIQFEDSKLNQEFEVYCTLLDALANKWTRSIAQTLNYLLQDLKEEEIADILKISQPAVNSRKKSAQWDAIDTLLKRYVYIVMQ